jgi:hypothetical protein
VVTAGVPSVIIVDRNPIKWHAEKWLWQIPFGVPVVPEDQNTMQMSVLVSSVTKGSGASCSSVPSSIASKSAQPSTEPKLKIGIRFFEFSSMEATAFLTFLKVSSIQMTSLALVSLS